MIDDDDNKELPKVTEVKKKLKNTITKLMTHRNEGPDVSFFTEKIYEKIDTEDPIKNNFWTEIIIRTI